MRYAIVLAASLIIILALSPDILGGERDNDADARPVDALIVLEDVLPEGGVGELTAIRIAEPRKLAALEAFFPGYRKHPSRDLAGGWEAGYRVYFNFPGGETIRITVSANDHARSWTTGHGDFETRGDFEVFVRDLRSGIPPSPREDASRQESLQDDARQMASAYKTWQGNPADEGARREAAALARTLAPHQGPGYPLAWEVLVRTGTLKDGMSLDEARALLGRPTTRTDQYVEWYFNPLNRHVAPFLRAKITDEGLVGWRRGNR
jgi:hypothetical protein